MGKHLPPSGNKHLKEEKPSYLNIALKEGKNAHGRDYIKALSKINIILTGFAAFLLLLGCCLKAYPVLSMVLFIVSFAAAGIPCFIGAFEKLCRIKPLEDEVLISLAAIIAMALGRFGAAAAVVVSYGLVVLMSAFVDKRTSAVLSGMRISLPETVKLEGENGPEERTVELLVEDDVITIAPGETVAADGIIIEGMSALDLSPVAGDGVTRTVSVGSWVLSGCINLSAPIKVRVERIHMESTAVVISELLEKSGKYKSSISKLSERFGRYFTPVCLVAAFIIGIIPPAFSGEWRRWLASAVVLLSVSGCKTLIRSAELVFGAAVAESAKEGVVVKGVRFLESLAKARTVIFNKTGTLTEGRYFLIDIEPRGIEENELLSVAAAAERYSSHPIAGAICRAEGIAFGVQDTEECFEEIPGRGVSVWLGNKHVFVGNAALLEENGISCDIPKKGGAAIHVAVNGKYCGYLLVGDRIREAAFDSIEALRRQGVKNVVMLTADMRSVARPIASSLNIDMVKAELGEAGKVSAVEYLLATKAERSQLVYVGNGAEDEEALSRADVGISLGALGSEAAMELADIMVMSQDLRKLPAVMKIAVNAYSAAGINFLAAVASKLFVTMLAVVGVMGIVPAVCIDLVVSAFCFGNSVRFIYNKQEKGKKK